MSILSFLLYLAGVIFFSFILWRKLKEDYPSERIFLVTLVLLGVGVLSLGVSSWVLIDRLPFRDFSFWVLAIFNVLFGIYVIKKLEFKFFEFTDALAPSWLWLIFFFSLAGFLQDWKNFAGLSYPAGALLSFFTYHFLLSKYRRFSWYPSGKVGFAGFASLGVYFLLRAGVAIYSATLLLFKGGIFEILANLFAFTLLMFIVYMRSGRAGADILSRLRKK